MEQCSGRGRAHKVPAEGLEGMPSIERAVCRARQTERLDPTQRLGGSYAWIPDPARLCRVWTTRPTAHVLPWLRGFVILFCFGVTSCRPRVSAGGQRI